MKTEKLLIPLGAKVLWVDDKSNGLLIGRASNTTDTFYFVHFADDYLNQFDDGNDVTEWLDGYSYKPGVTQGLWLSRAELAILK